MPAVSRANLAAVLLSMLPLGSAYGLAESGNTELAQLLQCVEARVDKQARSLSVEIIDEGVEPRQPARVFGQVDIDAKQSGRSLRFQVDAPGDVAGTSYLLKQVADQREMFVYLPAMQRSQRLTSDSRLHLLGSGFELSQLANLLQGFSDTAVTGGRTVVEHNETFRKVFLSGQQANDGGLHGAMLWINTRSCQTAKMTLTDGSAVDFSYASDDAQWPTEIVISNTAMKVSSRLRIRDVRPLSSTQVFTQEHYFKR